MPEEIMVGKTDYAAILHASLNTFNTNLEKHPEWFAKPVVIMGKHRWYLQDILDFHPGIKIPSSVSRKISKTTDSEAVQ